MTWPQSCKVSEVNESSESTLTTPWDKAAIDKTPRPVVAVFWVLYAKLALPGRRRETVNISELLAQGQMASDRSPFAENTLKNWSHDDRLQGFAPSATRSIRKLDRLMSLWSFVANKPQWRSRDFTRQHDVRYFVISCIHDEGRCFIKAYGMKRMCMPLRTLVKMACQRPTSRLKSSTQTVVSPSV